MKKLKDIAKRVTVALLSAALLTNSMDVTALATESNTEKGESVRITGFSELSDTIRDQTLPVGADESEIIFPDSLTVTVEKSNKAEGNSTEDKATEVSNEEKRTEEAADPDSREKDEQDIDGSKAQETEDTGEGSSQEVPVADFFLPPLTVYAAELGEDKDAENKDTAISEEISIDGIKWAIDADRSSSDEFSSDKAGDKFIYQPEIPDGYTVDATLPTITVTIEEKKEDKETPAFEETKSIDGVKITVSADEVVFPEGAVLSVEKVTKEQEKKAEEAVEEKRSDNQNVAASYTYDIKVLDKDGNEIQPADENKVKVSFKLEEVSDSNLETNIYHIKEADSDGTASGEKSGNDKADSEEISEGSDADLGNKASENTELVAEKLEVETDGDTAIAETDGFSLYTVEFTYNNLEYVLPGDTSVPMSEILTTLGLTGEVTAVEISDSSLFSASNETGEWIVTAHQAFDTTEWMKVTINDVVYEITVTDTTMEPTAVGSTDYALFTGFTATGGNGTNYANLVDGNTSSDWNATKNYDDPNAPANDFAGGTDDPAFVEFHADKPFIPKGYVLTCDHEDAGFWKPVEWALKAKLNEGDVWTTIHSSTTTLGTGKTFNIDCTNTGDNPYQYFRFEVYGVGTTMKVDLDELQFYGKLCLVQAREATCTEYGLSAACYGGFGDKYYSDDCAKTELTVGNGLIEKLAHTPQHHEATSTNIEYWTCSVCGKYFSDSDCTTEITEAETQTTVFGTLADGCYTLTSQTYTLTADVNTAGYIYIPAGVTATIDLAGHTIDRGLTSAVENGYVIEVAGTLTLTDSSTGGTVRGGMGSSTNKTSCVYVPDGGTFTLAGGTLIGNTSNEGNRAVYVAFSAHFIMTGGKITGDVCGINASGHLTISGGEISGNSQRGIYSGSYSISVSGNPRIMGNGDVNVNLYYNDAARLTVTGALTEGASIGITPHGTPTANAPVTVTSGYGTYNTASPDTYFTLDNNSFVLGWNEDRTEVAVGTELYTVGFDMNGHGSAIDAVSVLSGCKVLEPTAPTADGWYFVGWFTDADCTAGNEYDFDDAVTSNKTLHALWTQTAIHSITLPEKMVIVSADQEAVGGKYPVGTNIRFKVKSADYVVDGDVKNGEDVLTADGDGIYTVTMGDADITITATVKKAAEPNVTLSGSESYTANDGDVLTGSTSGTVTIPDNAKITLSDVTISGGIVCEGTAEITLVGENAVGVTSLDGTLIYKTAGIQIGSSGTTLTIKGNGSLNATGGSASAGIGLGRTWDANATGGSVVIEGGTVTASGGNGIGTGTVGNEKTASIDGIIIKGGTVNARLGKGTINYGSSVTIGAIKIYDTIDKVDASAITESVTYMHDETDVTASASTYFTIIEDGDRRVITPKDDTDYTITIADDIEHGSIACAATTAKFGDKVTITATPDFGYRLSRLVVKDAENNDVASTGNSFFMPKGNVTVSAVFEQGVHGTTEFAWGYFGPSGFVREASIYDGLTTVNLQQGQSFQILKYDENSYRKFLLDNDTYNATIPYSGGTGTFPEYENGTNFSVDYNGESGYYDIKMTDVGNDKWSVSILKTVPVVADIPDQTYTGSEIKPEPQVMAGSLNLTKGTDYEYSYSDNTNVGTAKVIVTFKGDYESLGSVEKEFNIASHSHNFAYSAEGATITATCNKPNCPLTDSKATLTIVKPAMTTYGDGSSEKATLDGLDSFNSATGLNIAATSIKYVGRGDTAYTESATAPTEAGTYTASITAGSKAASEDYEIAKAEPNIGTVTATIPDNTTDVSKVALSKSGSATGTLALTSTSLQYGENTCDWEFTPEDSTNYKTVTGTVTVNVTDTIAPSGKISIKVNEWSEFLSTITFGWYKPSDKVTITADDKDENEGNGSGIKQILYYEYVTDSTTGMTEDAVKALSADKWKTYGSPFSVAQDKKCIFYVKIIDNQNNTKYISSSGTAFDGTAPVITGIENGASVAYTDAGVELSISDAGELATITMDGTGKALSGQSATETVKNAGSHTVKVEDAAGNATTIAFTITKATINPTVDITGWTYGTYDENTNKPSVTGNTGNGTVSFLYKLKNAADSAYSAAVPTQAGEYTVKANIAESDNYAAGSATKDFTISKAAITPTVSISGWTYGGTAGTPTVAGNSGNGTVTYEYKKQSEADTAYVSAVPTNAGDYTIRATISESTNYQGGSATATFTIAKGTDPAIVTTTATLQKGGKTLDLSKLVSGAKGTVSFAFKDDESKGGCTLAGNTLTSGANEGTAVIKVTIADSDNCNGRNTDEITVSIVDKETKSLAVTQDDVTYGGTAVNPSYTEESGATNETVSYTGTLRKDGSAYSASTAPTEAGSYSVAVSYETDTAIYSGSTTFTIKPLDIKNAVVTLDDTALTYTGSAQTKSVSGVVINSKTIAEGDYSVTGNTGTNAGSYTVTVTAKDSSNYSGTATEKFTIAKVSLSVTADAKTKKYGQADPALTFNTTGFVNSETADSLKTGSLTRVAGENVGTYAIEKGTLSFGNNYSINFTGANFVITQADGDTAKPAKPELKSKTDTTIEVNEVAGYEYSKDNGEHWQSSGKFTGLTADTPYRIITRKAETTNVKAGVSSDELTIKTNKTAGQTTEVIGKIGSGEIEVETIIEPGVPESVIQGMTSELVTSLLTDEERTAVQNGATVIVTLDVKKIDGTVSGNDKSLTETAAKNVSSNAVVGMYLDISLTKQIGEGEVKPVTETNGKKISVVVKVPDSLQNKDANVVRTFYIIRIHNEEVKVLATTTETSIPFESDEFSTYSIAYSDAAKGGSGSGGDTPTPSQTYKIAFNANGGIGTMLVQSIKGTANLSANAFTRSGYSFNGWNTQANGSGTAYADKASVTPTADMTLYAQWKSDGGSSGGGGDTPTQPVTYTVSFNANGGSGTMPAQTISGTAKLSANVFTRNGYSFNGWNTKADGSGTAYADQASVTPTGNMTLYAQWKSNGGGGDTPTPSPGHTHSYTSSVTKEPTCTEKGVRTYTCSCGESYTEEIPALGHNYSSKVTKEPTHKAEGIRTYTCSRCGHSYTEKIPKLEGEKQTKKLTASTTYKKEKISVSVNMSWYDEATYTGKKLTASDLNYKLNLSSLYNEVTIRKGNYAPEDLFKITYVNKNNLHKSTAKKKASFYAKITLNEKTAKKAGLTKKEIARLKAIVTALNKQLKKNPCVYTIDPVELDAEGVEIVVDVTWTKKGKIKKVKSIKVTAYVNGEQKTFKLKSGQYKITVKDSSTKTVKITGKGDFAGTATVSTK